MAEQVVELIQLEHAPDIPGLIFRGFRGAEDYPIILEIVNAAKQADGIEFAMTLEIVARNFETLLNCDLYEDVIFAEVDGRPVAYSLIRWKLHNDYSSEKPYLAYWTSGYVHPDFRRKGIGTALLKHNESLQRQRTREMITNGEISADIDPYVYSYHWEDQIGNQSLMEKNGYEPASYFADMTRPDLENIPELSLPDGVELRPVTWDDFDTIWDAMHEAFKDHWGYSEAAWTDPNKKKWYRDDSNQDPSLWKVAWAGDRVVGTVLTLIDHDENKEYNRLRGWTEDISTARDFRRKGIAKFLIAESLKELKKQGMTSAALGVHVGNPNGAFALYESMGYEIYQQLVDVRKPLEI